MFLLQWPQTGNDFHLNDKNKLKIQHKFHFLFENENSETAAHSGIGEGSLSGP